MDKVKLTALIITLNGERLMDVCLASLGFCDRILVVDSFSTDATEEICRRRGAIFIQHAWPGNADQIRYGLEWLEQNAPTEWILMLDCDEVISPELRAGIEEAVRTEGGPGAWSMPRKTWYFDRFLRHGGCYPDRLFRLFRPDGIRIENSGAHQKFVPSGAHGMLTGDLLHYTYSGFRNQLDKLNDYAERGARDLEAKGRKGGVLTGIIHGTWRFIDMYLVHGGFLDGRAGFLMAAHASFYTLLKYVRIGEGDWGQSHAAALLKTFSAPSRKG